MTPRNLKKVIDNHSGKGKKDSPASGKIKTRIDRSVALNRESAHRIWNGELI